MDDEVNYYDLLGVSNTATSDEIKLAYRSKIKQWHPDKNRSVNAEKIASQLNEAKDTLLDEDKREKYDDYLKYKVNDNYENLHQKQEKRTRQEESVKTETTKEEYPKQEEKEELYTKWEYFKLYLKYYNISKIRKMFGVIFVILETILCSILSVINILLAYTIVYLYEFVDALLTVSSLLMLFLIFQKLNEGMITEGGIIAKILLALILYISKYLLPTYASILIYINPKLINKLNIKLFGLAIGYKSPKRKAK